MPEIGVPRILNLATAAAISGGSHKAMCRLVEDGVVAAEMHGRRPCVVTESLEEHLRRPITCQQFLLAERTLDAERERKRDYAANRRERSDAVT